MSDARIKTAVEIKRTNGILRLKPAWVARDFLPPGRRLGLPNEMYELGDRGGICERWIASTTSADNRVPVPDEGISFIRTDDGEVSLKDAVEAAGELIMGSKYAEEHEGLGRLAKIFDYKYRLPYHIHQMQEHAKLVGCNSKEEAYYFPEDVPPGPEPETYFGVHPYIAQQKKYDLLLPHMEEWKDDAILQHARAYKQIPGDGWHVPSGTLHAPGSALTIELQEDSDVFAMLQADTGGKIIDKELLFKDVSEGERRKKGEKAVLEMINWDISGDPFFYENRHTPPVLMEGSVKNGGKEYWIFYNTHKFSGKKLVIAPGGEYTTEDNGVYNILVWKGKGTYGGFKIEGGNHDEDELLICHDAAVKGIEVKNNGKEDLIIYKFFGPDINKDLPFLENYKG